MSWDSCKLNANLAAAQVHLLWKPPENSWGAMGESDGRWLTQSLKEVSLGGFLSCLWVPAFCGMKALQKQSTARKSIVASWVPLYIFKSMVRASWYLGSSESAGVLHWGTIETVALHQRSGWAVFWSATGFHVPVSKFYPVTLRKDLLCRLRFKGSGLSCSGRQQLVPLPLQKQAATFN